MAPRDPLILPVPRRPDSEATYAQLSEVGATLGDAYNIGSSAYDGVVDLEQRADLLEGVVAYGNQSLSLNQWVVHGSGSAVTWLPYGLQVGPRKGVNVVTIGSGSNVGTGFQLLSAGLWRVDALTQVWDTPFTGANWADLEIQVMRPDNSLYEAKRFTVDCPEGVHMSIGGPHSFVVPTVGYKVFVAGRSGRWRRFMGGTLYSTLSINKWDNNFTSQPPNTVGDSEYPD